MMSKKQQTGVSADEPAILRAQARICLDLAAKARELWVSACLTDRAQELLSGANRNR